MDICFLAQKFFSLENKRYICPKQLVNVTNGNTLFFFSHRIAVGSLAQKRLARGIKLNYIEATALISSQLLEFMRDGCYSVSQLMDLGKQILGRRHVLPDTIDLVCEIQVEGTFPDGTYLVTVHEPICTDNGNLEMALYGSFYPIPDESKFPLPTGTRNKEDAPGAIIAMPIPIQLNTNRKRLSLTVTNHGDRAIQVKYLQLAYG